MQEKNLTLGVPIGEALESVVGVRLLVEGLQRTKESMAIRVFVNAPEADAETPVEGNPNFVGTLYLYGHGQEEPVAEEHPERAAAQRLPYDQHLDLSEQLRLVGPGSQKLWVTFVAVDFQDRGLDPELIQFQRLSLVPGD